VPIGQYSGDRSPQVRNPLRDGIIAKKFQRLSLIIYRKNTNVCYDHESGSCLEDITELGG